MEKKYWEKICNANMGASALDGDENDLEECEDGSSDVTQALMVQVICYLILCYVLSNMYVSIAREIIAI